MVSNGDSRLGPSTQEVLRLEVVRLHRAVDVMWTQVAQRQPAPLSCVKGCAACCRDDVTVFVVEAAPIRAAYGALLAHGAPAPAGVCAFLDAEKCCRIYPHRPYVCRTQGLPLRWLDEAVGAAHGTATAREWRDICPRNEPPIPLTQLEAAACWSIGPVEARLAALQAAYQQAGPGPYPAAAALHRVALRDLFAPVGPGF